MSDDESTTATNATGATPKVRLPGSDRPQPGTDAGLAPLPADERIEATVVLRRQADLPGAEVAAGTLTRDELAARYGASQSDIDAVTAALTAEGVRIDSVDAGSRRMRVSGTVADLARAFDTDLRTPAGDQHVDSGEPGAAPRRRTGELSVPEPIADIVVAVLGLDNRPQTRALFRFVPAAAQSTSYTPVELAAVYGMPEADGTGQTIAIIELGGGFGQSDLDAYFSGLGLSTPKVTAASVDGAQNQPGQDPSGADGEVLLDIEVAGAIAPKADIVVYFAPNTDAGFLDAVSQAAHADPTPCAISISWGQGENQWTAQARSAMDAAFADAAALGATVTVAAGDDGSTDRETDGQSHVDFPASSPHALGCGGTTLVASGTTVSSETVWNEQPDHGATGGGVSTAFALPDYQKNAGVPASASRTGGRGVPDVAAVADPTTGYQVLVDGTRTVIGGTSAVAPLWAGLIARYCQLLNRKLGLLQPVLYGGVTAGAVAPGFRDIVSGNNGAFQAGPGWDACTGLGVPDGTALLDVLKAASGTG